MPGLRTDCQTDPKLARARADRKGQHARDAHDGNGQSNTSKSAEYDAVEPVGSEHRGANVFERRGMLHRLVDGHFSDDARHGRDQRIRIHARVHEQASAEDTHPVVGKIVGDEAELFRNLED